MSDISIPGISNSSGMDTSKMVDDIMEVERIPVRRMEREVETYQEQKDAWQSMGRQISRLRDTARQMYGFENPFRNRLASTTNDGVIQATATRQAEEGIEEVTVLQTAGRDRFASVPVSRDMQIPRGRYGFSVGEDTRSVRFGGGSLRDFAAEINRRIGDTVRATVVPDTSDTQVIVFAGQREGASAQLAFSEDSVPLMEEIGVMRQPRPEQSVALLQDESLLLEPGATEQIRLEQPFEITDGMVLRFQARSRNLEREAWEPPPTPPGVESPDPGATTLGDVTVQNEQLGFDLPQARSAGATAVCRKQSGDVHPRRRCRTTASPTPGIRGISNG